MLRRLVDFFVSPIASPPVEALYRACVAQARLPAFYATLHVPDTVEGRFDLLILHTLLVILRLQDYPRQTQQLFDILFADMDKNLREMGVSDISLPKKMKPMLAAFYGRAKAYEQALMAQDDVLANSLRRNIYGKTHATGEDVQKLTGYVRCAHKALAECKVDDLLIGILKFPVVTAYV